MIYLSVDVVSLTPLVVFKSKLLVYLLHAKGEEEGEGKETQGDR